MPRFYFHQRQRSGMVPDPEGSDLPDLEAAVLEAIASARELMSEAILEGWDISARSFEVVDDTGSTVLVVSFREAYSVLD